MVVHSWKLRAYVLAAALTLFCANSRAQTTLLDEVHTIAAADQAVPIEHSFTIPIDGTYTITLTDLGAGLTPSAPLASVKLGITRGSSVVALTGAAVVDPKVLPAAGSAQFAATAGTYVIHVVGAPGAIAGSGPIGMVVSSSGADTIAGFSDIVALPPATLSSNEALLDDSFTVTAAGTYQVTLADLKLPQSLGTLTLLLTQAGASSPLAILPDPTNNNALQKLVSLQQGITYRIFAIGQEASAVNGGLYSAVVGPSGGGAPVFNRTLPIGGVTLLASQSLSAGTYTLNVSDLAFPAALTQLGVVAVANGQISAQLSAAGSQTFAATADTYQVFGLGTAATVPGAGSYAMTLQPQAGPAAVSVARAVTTAGGTLAAYSLDTTVASSGSYSLELADFSFPSKFTTISAAAVQNGAVLGNSLQAAGSQSVSAAAGPLSMLVFAQPGASGSLFGIDLMASGGASPVFETTQGVGQLFSARKVSVMTAGDYGATVSDVGFPTQLATFAVIVTQGTTHLGSIFGGGTVSFAAKPGNYFINFIAEPGGTDKAGTYAMAVASAPVVTLQSSAGSVSAGGTVKLTWTSQNATGCTASGGWSGTQPLSGSATSPVINSATTFTLTCTGAGGPIAQSVNVAVDAPAPAKSGGGGALTSDLLILLSLIALLRWATSRDRRAL